METRKKKKIYIFYLILIVASCFSFVVSNVSYDAEYQLAMAYRIIKGDQMILEMWEPHQTSAFLCAILMKIYMVITGTTTGIVLYTQVMGLLIRGGIAALFYKEIKELSGDVVAFIAGVTYLLISPKELLTPEFGNMQLWFGTLLFLALLKYFKTEKTRYLVWAAISFCLGVFSYPSFILVCIAVVIVLIRYSKHAKRDIFIVAGISTLIGGVFVAYLLISVGWETIVNCLSAALAVEPSHTVGPLEKVWGHVLNIGQICGMLAIVGVIGFIIENIVCLIISKKKKEKQKISWNRWLMISWFALMFFLLLNILSVSYRGGYAFPFIVILVLGFCKRNLLSIDEKRMYYSAFWISGFSLIATLVLSDNAFLQAVTYMLILICASMLPICHWFKEISKDAVIRKMFLVGMHIFFLLIIFKCIYIHIPIQGRGQIYSIAQDMALIRSGPAMGIITDAAGAEKQRDSMEEWKEYIKPGDTIWILGEPVDTLGYLYEDVEVGAPTVMSTPTYSEELLYYWELNPEKYPDVVIVASSFGELAWEIRANEWLMQWLEEEYCADTVIDGNYWRYYFKE